jgi:hypothetical protein
VPDEENEEGEEKRAKNTAGKRTGIKTRRLRKNKRSI